jgi:hypothetical protein
VGNHSSWQSLLIPGYLSDLPNVPMYRVVRTLPDGRAVYRSLRTSSALEGGHHDLRRAQNSKSKCAGARRHNAALRAWQFVATTKAAIKAKKMPPIGHYDIHLRYRLMDIVRGTPHEGQLKEVIGWKRVDLSIAPTVPRGVDSSGLLARGDDDLPSPPTARHSMMSQATYTQTMFGHGRISDLSNAQDIETARLHPEEMIRASNSVSATEHKRISDALGFVPTKASLSNFTVLHGSRQSANQALKRHCYKDHVQENRTAAPTQAFPLLPHPLQHTPDPLPPQPLPICLGHKVSTVTQVVVL